MTDRNTRVSSSKHANCNVGAHVSYFWPLSCDVDRGCSLEQERVEMVRIYSVFANGMRKNGGGGEGRREGQDEAEPPPVDSMFSAGKVGSRVEPWPGLAVYHTSC